MLLSLNRIYKLHIITTICAYNYCVMRCSSQWGCTAMVAPAMVAPAIITCENPHLQ